MHIRRSRYLRHRFPREIISHAVWLYHRYCLSFRDVEDLLAERGIIVSYETIRQCAGSSAPITPGGCSDVKVDSEIRDRWSYPRPEGLLHPRAVRLRMDPGDGHAADTVRLILCGLCAHVTGRRLALGLAAAPAASGACMRS